MMERKNMWFSKSFKTMTLFRYLWNQNVSKLAVMISLSVIIPLILSLNQLSTLRDDHPQAEIYNGLVTARIFLPDP